MSGLPSLVNAKCRLEEVDISLRTLVLINGMPVFRLQPASFGDLRFIAAMIRILWVKLYKSPCPTASFSIQVFELLQQFHVSNLPEVVRLTLAKGREECCLLGFPLVKLIDRDAHGLQTFLKSR